MMPSAMPAWIAAACAPVELLVELPLQPAVEVDCVAVLVDELGDRLRRAGWRSSSGHSCQSPP